MLGAGPAGLTGAYVLSLRGRSAFVVEGDGAVGGLAKTARFNGYRFDLGGHRFYTKLKPIQHLWQEWLGDELLARPRLSRIYYQGKYFSYPLTSRDVVGRLGLAESTRCALSYLWALRGRRRQPVSFEDWVTTRFGRRLYDAFFRSYSEKVWGIPGSEIRSEWAAQRIKNFSLFKALLSILHLRGDVPTLIDEFHYPRLGPGQMWEAVRARVEERGIPVLLNTRCVSLEHAHDRITSITVSSESGPATYPVGGVLSSIPLSELVLGLRPEAPAEVLAAARRLRYRDLCVVALMTSESQPFPDNWIYLHDPETRAGRVQNYGAWSKDMVRDGSTCLGVEYFCFEGDEIWELPDDEAVALATEELARIGLIDPGAVFDGVKIRVPKAYPMYDAGYVDSTATIREYLTGFHNLVTCGRNGLHRYNNQDHSMWTAILATLNLIAGASHDVWSVNTDDEYLEEGAVLDALVELALVE